MLANKYDSMDYLSQTQIITSVNSIIITTTNYKLIDALLKDRDFIMSEVK